MGTSGIPLDKAELLSVLLEALLYGFSLFMFGGAVWALSSQRSTLRINYKMLAAACMLLLFSTVHLVVDIIRVMQGFISLPDNHSRERVAYFSDVSHWTFVSKNVLYAAQTLIGDGVVLYRCYAVWRSKPVMILPGLLWCAVAVTGFACPYVESRVTGVFEKNLSRWITSFWASTLVTNIVTTLMLAYRIWCVDQKTTQLCDHRKSELRPILLIVVDAGAVYSFTLCVALICYANKSNSQYVILDMIMPIISITFYMVIIRVGLANRTSQPANPRSFGHTSSTHSFAGDRRSRMQIDVTVLGEDKVDDARRSSMSPISPSSGDGHRRTEVKFESIDEV